MDIESCEGSLNFQTGAQEGAAPDTDSCLCLLSLAQKHT